ncbi:DNA gyrase subunit A [Leptolyngbya sp. FACHB-261]|uniref:DNA gyrase subunit A n=1 Tax=Leptolyngbya sp. FACHB-261 TaxID=2692806 RepID=UPI0016879E73|nr:DNA gyrase subunit A [Leptolyngbya sp. FACHB-261]MBD2104377.1 DNA gyrase subunit A [Leptolyngbya sp. FACHB-261]
MAKQLNLQEGKVIATALHTEMQQSYLEYAMSVIVGRALPDVRDGLKPVHRRILYAMHELGLTPDRPYRKCARVVGDVLGKYHPHGDQSVYDALVRLVQDFSSRYPLLAGHGNFGSVDNDPPAAMRYTECRLAGMGHEVLLDNISEATVDFTDNFDGSQQEPTVLPAQLPILLLNGSSGIAVGMATNVPPHNLNELVDGLIALIDNPELPDERLLELIPGPDFPTGGEIVGQEGIRDAYTTGRGSITLRGRAEVEEIQPGRGRHRRTAVVITEFPFQVSRDSWIEKVADLVNQGRLDGIADIRNESDRDGTRVVIELRREANPQKVLNSLYKLTPLQVNFGAILLALDDNQPRQMSLRELLTQFLNFRIETLTRLYSHEQEQKRARAHVVEGLLRALSDLDTVIDLLRHAPDGSTAKVQLQERLNLSDRQASEILAMPLRRLTGLERQNLQTEFQELNGRLRELERLLGSRNELLKVLKKDLRGLKRKHGDQRRTVISGAVTVSFEEEHEDIPDVPSLLQFTHRGYVRRSEVGPRRGRPPKEVNPEEAEDFVVETQVGSSRDDLLLLTRSGRAFSLKVAEVPLTSGRSRGTPLIGLLPQGEPIVARFTEGTYSESTCLLLLTRQGRIKRVPLAEFNELTGRGLSTLKLKDDDELIWAARVHTGDQVVLATSGGRLLRLMADEEQIPLMGRTAMGNQALRLRQGEGLIGAAVVRESTELALVTQKGYAKRLRASLLRLSQRGDLGVQVLPFSLKTDALMGIAAVTPETELLLTTDAPRLLRLSAQTIPPLGRDAEGRRVVQTNKSEKLTELTVMAVEVGPEG